MIDIETEKFTAEDAINAGLIDAVKNGETAIEGSYIVGKDGIIEFRQRNFTFKDKNGNLRTGKFDDAGELLAFCQIIRRGDN